MKLNKLCTALSVGVLSAYASSAFAANIANTDNTKSPYDYNISLETITSNIDDAAKSTLAEKISFKQNVFVNRGYTYFYQVRFQWANAGKYQLEPYMGVKKSFNDFINPELQIGLVHHFGNDVENGTMFSYKMSDSFKIYQKLSGKVELNNIGIKYHDERQDTVKLGPKYKVNDQVSVEAMFTKNVTKSGKGLELEAGYDF